MASIQEQQMGQVRPPGAATPVSLYSPGASETGVIVQIMICNNSGASASYSLYHDDDGTTYDETTQIANEIVLAANDFVIISCKIMANDATGNIACESSVANALTFTAYGHVITA